MPNEISRVFSDYRMNLLQVGESGQYHFGNEDVQILFETARYLYKGEFDKVREMFGDTMVKPDVGAMIGVMTDSDLIVEKAFESKGGMNMCTALEKLREEGKAKGFAERQNDCSPLAKTCEHVFCFAYTCMAEVYQFSSRHS